MYGMINAGVKSYVVTQLGEEAWILIHKDARVPAEFDFKANYNDDSTYNLVFAIAKYQKLEPKTVLELIGEHWIEYALSKDYGVIFKNYGKNFRSSLTTLNQMHKRMGTMMPAMIMPYFQVLSDTETEIKLVYTSTRKGLTPLAIGLIRGLGKYFSQPIDVKQISDATAETIAKADSKIQEVAVLQVLIK